MNRRTRWTLGISLAALVTTLGVIGLLALGPSGGPLAPQNESATATEADTRVADYTPDVTFKLRTVIAEGKMAFEGVGGAIDGQVNPNLDVEPGQVVQVTLVNGDGALHDISFPEFNATSDEIVGQGSSTSIVFRSSEEGTFDYFCTVPGHRQAGMEGQITVGETEAQADTGTSIVKNPTDMPDTVGDRDAQTVDVELTAEELEAQLADGTTFNYWTFNGTVPGPFVRVRVGDTVNVTLENAPDSTMNHSVDFHAVTGPGGGAVATQTAPGEETSFSFQALKPGLYVYHCATPMVAQHIANGMYGLILVEPEGGLPEVDQEFYVMQGEIYPVQDHGTSGRLSFSVDKMLDESPEYFVFNGAVGALTKQSPMRAEVGDTVRIFFGVGGPNHPSSFHVIGEIFDRVYDEASLTSEPKADVQTTLVPAGGATMVEFTLDVPGEYILVDHALSRMERGLVGFLHADGEPQPRIFQQGASD